MRHQTLGSRDPQEVRHLTVGKLPSKQDIALLPVTAWNFWNAKLFPRLLLHVTHTSTTQALAQNRLNASKNHGGVLLWHVCSYGGKKRRDKKMSESVLGHCFSTHFQMPSNFKLLQQKFPGEQSSQQLQPIRASQMIFC